jgi:hypothetical protein
MRWVPFLGSISVAAVMSGCASKSVETYVGKEGRLKAWMDSLATAVCELEVKHSGPALDALKRICPQGEDKPGDKTTPPAYPPAQ